MQIVLTDIGKRFGKNWIIRGVTECIEAGEQVAILGPNGSGKSTLLRLIATYFTPSEGSVAYLNNSEAVAIEDVPQHIAYAAPYLDLIEQMTLKEAVLHHQGFKPFINGMDVAAFLEVLALPGQEHKQLAGFSSGMKMKTKLALAVLSDTPVLLLDEPLSNIDRAGQDWYNNLIDQYAANRTVVVCSNHQQEEYGFCSRYLHLTVAE
jgi:ABC-type multidrug transport system ATPase subunit